MAKSFPVSGSIDPVEFPHLLVDLHHHGATGSLKVTGPHHPKALYFRGGRILFGSSNDPRDQLGSILIESGKITREQLDDVNTKVGPGNPLAKVLADSGFVNQRELGEAARVKVERILADVLSWDSGSFEFEDGVLPKGAVDLKLSTAKLLLAAVQRVGDRSFALRHVELRTVLAFVQESDPTLSEIRGEVWPLLERLDGKRSLKDAIALTRLDEFEAAKTACALLFLGVVRKTEEAGGAEELDLAREAQSGLGDADDSMPAFFAMPSQGASKARAFEAAEASDAPPATEETPFAFPEPAPAPAPEPSYAVAAEPEPEAEPTFVIPAAAEEDEPADALVVPSEPAPAFSAFQAEPEQAAPARAAEPPAQAPAAAEPPAAAPPAELPETVIMSEAPRFDAEPLPRVSFDTVPGDRPAYTPAPSSSSRPLPLVPPPPRRDRPASSPPAVPAREAAEIGLKPQARPTREDLAALDELLSPTASGRMAKPADRSRSGKFQPQFRPATTPPRRPPLRTPSASPSRVPLIVMALVAIVVGTAAAWYFLLRKAPGPLPPVTLAQQPRPVRPAATPAPTATPSSPSGAPASGSTAAPDAVPPQTLAPTPATPPITTPPTTQAPAPRPATPAANASADSAHALLLRGELPEAARAFAAALRPGARSRFSVQLLTACAPETVQKAVGATGAGELVILPVALNGRSCYRLCWGVYDDRRSAETAVGSVPSYFRQGGARPRVSALDELLP